MNELHLKMVQHFEPPWTLRGGTRSQLIIPADVWKEAPALGGTGAARTRTLQDAGARVVHRCAGHDTMRSAGQT